MKIEVVYSLWGADGADEPFTGGIHEIDAPSPRLMASIAAASSGPSPAVNVVEATKEERATLASLVQTQEDGEAAYAAAQESGRWQHGNISQFIVDAEQRLERASDEERPVLEAQLADARDALSNVAVPT